MFILRENADKYVGLSTDQKPISGTKDGSILKEMDTGREFYFSNGKWQNPPTAVTPEIEHAISEIYNTYGDTVSIIRKKKSLLKFGKFANLGTSEETIQDQGGTETLPSTNSIVKVSSSNVGDTQDIVIEGHTIDGDGNLTFSTQPITLTAQTPVTLTTSLARANRLYNNDSTDFAGDVYVYEDDTVIDGVPQTASKIHLKASGVNNQSFKGATSLSQDDYWLITKLYAAVDEKTAATVDLKLKVREKGKVFRTRISYVAASSGSSADIELRPYLIVPKNADVRIVGVASTTAVSVDAWANGYLAAVI